MPTAVCFVFWEGFVQDNFCVGWNLLLLNGLKIVFKEFECYINSSCSAVHGRENRLRVLRSDSWLWGDGVVKVPEERNQQLWHVLVVYTSGLELQVWGFLIVLENVSFDDDLILIAVVAGIVAVRHWRCWYQSRWWLLW